MQEEFVNSEDPWREQGHLRVKTLTLSMDSSGPLYTFRNFGDDTRVWFPPYFIPSVYKKKNSAS